MFTFQYSQLMLSMTLFLSLSDNNVDALKFWIELGRLSQVLILLFQKG